jgi:UDP-N-acetylglucosamine/UDP-N-acetylgalactosamine diphosphorylase
MASLSKRLESLMVSDTGTADIGPKEPSAEEFNEVKEKYEKAGQDQVFAFWDTLDTSQRGALFAQAKTFDPSHINILVDRVLNPAKADAAPPVLEQVPASTTSSLIDGSPEEAKIWYDAGLEHVSQNTVGVVLMAGGQGTRLGSSAPKGCYDIGLPSKKSLFQLQAERIYKVQKLAAKAHDKHEAVIPWYVMTSGPTRGPTEAFFRENNYFGLKEENIFIFEQGVLPCVSNDGKILLESKSKVSPPFFFCPWPRRITDG